MPNHSRQHADLPSELRQNPGFGGFHLCGACKRNKARQYRLLNEIERPAAAQRAPIGEANRRTSHWAQERL